MVMESKDKKIFHFKRLGKGFGYAFSGIFCTIREEQNMMIHFLMMMVVIGGGFFFEISTTEWLICILWIGIVLGAELFNTAIEKTVDFVSKEKSELAKKAKDASAGAVLILSCAAGITGFLIFLPKVIALFQ